MGYGAEGQYSLTIFANSEPGVIGLTIFFEVRPNGGQSVYDSSKYGTGGSDAMRAVAATAYNRSNTTNVDIYPGRPQSVSAAAKNMSSAWNHKPDGTSGLTSKNDKDLKILLAGPSNSQECDGLMYSWAMAQNFYSKYTNSNQGVPYFVNTNNTLHGTLWFNSTGKQPSVRETLHKSQFCILLG